MDLLDLKFDDKAESIMQFRQGILADAEAIKAESKRLLARSQSMERKAAWLQEYLHQNMLRLGIGKLSTTTFTASVCKSPPRVELEGLSPPQYLREVREFVFDKALALADYKANLPMPSGVKITTGTHLRIT